MRVFACGTPRRQGVCAAWSHGHNWQLIEQANPFYLPGDCAVWGLMRGARQIRENCRAMGFTYYAMDNAYVGRDDWFRVTRNGFQHTQIIERPPDRWERLKIKLEPWRRHGGRWPSGGRIVMRVPGMCDDYLKLKGRTHRTFRELRRYTDRKVVVRHKPATGEELSHRFLDDAYCVVTNVSACAVDALIRGIPVFVTGPSVALPMAETDLSKIESPRFPDREPWAWSLAYAQFNEWDMFTGRAKAMLDEHPSRAPMKRRSSCRCCGAPAVAMAKPASAVEQTECSVADVYGARHRAG
jgi:hypothetical protein